MLHTKNNTMTIVGLVKKGVFIAAAMLAVSLLAIGATGCSSASQEDVDALAQSYAQRMSELVGTCTQGKTDAVVEVSLLDKDFSFSSPVPAGEETPRTTERLATIGKSGIEAKNHNVDNKIDAMTYRGCTIKWSENGQMKTASDSNGDFHIDPPDQEQ